MGDSSFTCRICHEGSLSSAAPLVKPCMCSGSVGYVHSKCIIRWMASQGTTQCSICDHTISASLVYDDDLEEGVVPPLEADHSTLRNMAFKYLLQKGIYWGSRITLFVTLWIVAFPLLTALCCVACFGYPTLFVSDFHAWWSSGSVPHHHHNTTTAILTITTATTLISDDDLGTTVPSWWVVVVALWIIGVLMQPVIATLGPSLLWLNEHQNARAVHDEGDEVVVDEPPTPASNIRRVLHDVETNEEDEEPLSESDEPSEVLELSDESESSDEEARDYGARASNKSYATHSAPSLLLPPRYRFVELNEETTLMDALHTASQQYTEKDDVVPVRVEEGNFVTLSLCWDVSHNYKSTLFFFIAAVCIVSGTLAVPAVTVRCGYAVVAPLVRNSASVVSSLFDWPLANQLFLIATTSNVVVQQYVFASIISNSVFGPLADFNNNSYTQLPMNGGLSIMSTLMVWMLASSLVSKCLAMSLPPRARAVVRSVFECIHLVSVTAMYFISLAITGGLLVTSLSDMYIGTSPDGSPIVTPDQAFRVVGGSVKVPACYSGTHVVESKGVSFTGTIAALRILQTNPLPKNTCGNYYDFGNCTQEQLRSKSVRMYLSYCGAFEEEE